jgi:hypothetical protein
MCPRLDLLRRGVIEPFALQTDYTHILLIRWFTHQAYLVSRNVASIIPCVAFHDARRRRPRPPPPPPLPLLRPMLWYGITRQMCSPWFHFIFITFIEPQGTSHLQATSSDTFEPPLLSPSLVCRVVSCGTSVISDLAENRPIFGQNHQTPTVCRLYQILQVATFTDKALTVRSSFVAGSMSCRVRLRPPSSRVGRPG